LTLRFIRTWLPAIIVGTGVLLWVISPSVDTAEGSAGIIGAGLSIWLLNILFRIGVKGDIERDEENAARHYFDEHGHWPDERPRDRPTAASTPPAAPRPHDSPARARVPRRPS
jgi:hypothetical protein